LDYEQVCMQGHTYPYKLTCCHQHSPQPVPACRCTARLRTDLSSRQCSVDSLVWLCFQGSHHSWSLAASPAVLPHLPSPAPSPWSRGGLPGVHEQ
jgi:hypothetical protein